MARDFSLLKSAQEGIGLSSVYELFKREQISDEIVDKLSDHELSKLGVETTGDRHRLRSIMKTRRALNDQSETIGKKLPSMQFLFHHPEIPLTVKKLTTLPKPAFSEEGSNKRLAENAVNRKFIKYLREVASGRREGLNIQSILQFLTGADEEPVLGFRIHPSINFVESGSF